MVDPGCVAAAAGPRPRCATPRRARWSPGSRPRDSTSARRSSTPARSARPRSATLTFHQRAVLLKQMALVLTERKAELYAAVEPHGRDEAGLVGRHRRRHRRALHVLRQGASRDAERARSTSTAPSRASRRTVHSSGGISTPACPASPCRSTRSTSPCGARSRSSRPAFLAGVPTLVKPATPTGYLAEAFVRILVESGLLPEGSLQLVSGSVPTLFDHLRLGDLVAFTGSASTAERLRAHDSVQTGGVRFTSETDSINASVLGTDAGRGHARVRRVREAARRRDDDEGGAEVHGDPPGDRARGIRRCRGRRGARAHRRARRAGRPARRGRDDGAARVASSSATRCCARSRSSRRPAASS